MKTSIETFKNILDTDYPNWKVRVFSVLVGNRVSINIQIIVPTFQTMYIFKNYKQFFFLTFV